MLLPERRFPSVVVTHAASGKFVNLTVYQGHPMADFPTAQLSVEQKAKAARLFLRFGITTPNTMHAPLTDGSHRVTETYQLARRTTHAAAQLVFEIFAEVFGLRPSDPLEMIDGTPS